MLIVVRLHGAPYLAQLATANNLYERLKAARTPKIEEK
jgi:hypothetical protein